jgi:hypothetical protein
MSIFKSLFIITFLSLLFSCNGEYQGVGGIGPKGSSSPFASFNRNGYSSVPTSSNVQDYLDDYVSNVPSTCPVFVDGESDGQELPRIADSGKHAWDPKWSKSALNTLNKDEFKRMLSKNLSSDETKQLNCPNFNSMSDEDKKKFYIILIASMAHTESGYKPNTYFDENAYAKKMGNSKKIDDSYGLLQIDPGNAAGVRNCGVSKVNKSGGVVRGRSNDGGLYDGDKNVECGLVFLNWQLTKSKDKKIFSNKSYWSALRPSNKSSVKTAKKFRSQISQISACNKGSSSFPLAPSLGEQKVLDSDARCTKISNNSRKNKPIDQDNPLYGKPTESSGKNNNTSM